MTHGLARHEAGAAATELAIVAPVLLLMLFGTASYFINARADYRAKRATYTASDMVARQVSVDDAFLATVKAMAENVAQTKGAAMGLRITSVSRSGDTNKVDWSYAAPPYEAAKDVPDVTIPEIETGDSVIVVETSTPYSFSVPLVGAGVRSLANVSFARPRLVSRVAKS